MYLITIVITVESSFYDFTVHFETVLGIIGFLTETKSNMWLG